MKKGLIGKKIGMTQIFDEAGNVIPVTVVEAGPCTVTQIKTVENDGYQAVQVGFGDVAKYEVDSNELFIVNSLAEGIARGGVQTASNTEYTISAKREQISLYVDWLNISTL